MYEARGATATAAALLDKYASAMAYSLVETVKANGLIPFEYFKFLFECLPNIEQDRYAECLPWSDEARYRCKIPQ
jgi:hypothetical protein